LSSDDAVFIFGCAVELGAAVGAFCGLAPDPLDPVPLWHPANNTKAVPVVNKLFQFQINFNSLTFHPRLHYLNPCIAQLVILKI
jgi:hypothetical protein